MTRARGFTLVELLVALGLFTVIAGAIYAVSAVGVRCWTQAQEALTTLPRLTGCLEHLATQLRGSVIVPDLPWTSGTGSLTFVTAEHGLVPVAITYQRTSEGRLVEHQRALATRMVRDYQWLPQVAALDVCYGYRTEDGTVTWEPRWTDRDQPPQLVQVTLTSGAPGHPGRTLTKTVLIPTGVLGTYERGGRA